MLARDFLIRDIPDFAGFAYLKFIWWGVASGAKFPDIPVFAAFMLYGGRSQPRYPDFPERFGPRRADILTTRSVIFVSFAVSVSRSTS